MVFNPNNCRNESEVESKLIVSYLLPKLGYTPDTWHQEISFGNIRLDFLSFATQAIPMVIDADSPMSVIIQYSLPKRREAIPKRYDFEIMESVIYERDDLAKCAEQIQIVGNMEIADPVSVLDFKPDSIASQEFEMLAIEVLEKIGEKS